MSEAADDGAATAAAPDAIRAEHIRKRFGAVTALEDVNLRLGQGEVLGLIGDNGAGKSTLVKIPPASTSRTAARSTSSARRSSSGR
jgi:ABC-type sugar transport system ATPase subunit